MNINNYAPASGRKVKEDGSTVNTADLLEQINAKLTKMEHYGKSTDTKPTNEDVPVGATFFEIDTATAYMNDGTSWVVI